MDLSYSFYYYSGRFLKTIYRSVFNRFTSLSTLFKKNIYFVMLPAQLRSLKDFQFYQRHHYMFTSQCKLQGRRPHSQYTCVLINTLNVLFMKHEESRALSCTVETACPWYIGLCLEWVKYFSLNITVTMLVQCWPSGYDAGPSNKTALSLMKKPPVIKQTKQ